MNSILVFISVGGKIRIGWSLWIGRPWRRWAWLHFFILITGALYSASSLLESTISHIWFGDSRRTRFAPESSLRSILQPTETHLIQPRSNFQICADDYLQPSRWKFFFLLPLEHLLACYTDPNCFVTYYFITFAECENSLTGQCVFRTYAIYAFMAT
jgi:hypothetical protein